jgi:hypothetical protein
LGENAQRIARENYTWEAVVARQVRFYETLMQQSS